MTPGAGPRPGGRAALVALAVGALAVGLAGAGLWQQRTPAGTGRTAVQVAAVDAAPTPSLAPRAAPAVGRRDAGLVAAPAAVLPVAVAVPALGLGAQVDPVGVQPDGSMTVPADPDRVGWYRFGPAPGAAHGSAVLAGHVDTARDGPGAFAALVDIEVGQDVLVTMDDGAVVTYRVEGRESVVKRELPVDVLFARDGPARLTLITCGGPFQPELRSYRDNLVVTAVPVVP